MIRISKHLCLIALSLALITLCSLERGLAWADSSSTLTAASTLKASDLTSANPLPNGIYRISSALSSNNYLQVKSSSKQNKAGLIITGAFGRQSQLWHVRAVGNGYYEISNVNSGKAMAIPGASTKGGTLVHQFRRKGTLAQKWRIKRNADGTYRIVAGTSAKLRLGVQGAQVASGTSILVTKAKKGLARKWNFSLVKQVSSDGLTTYDEMTCTLKQMARYQKDNPYYAKMKLKAIMPLVNPTTTAQTAFADLRGTTGISAKQLNSYINSTALGRSGMLRGLGSAFTRAARKYGINEAYLLAHAILESGWGSSELARGYYYKGGKIDGVKYPAGTYYNFYGIGAYDTSPLSGGRKLAIINGWDSPAKAVTGAARWINTYYIRASSYAQPTLYAMKWDYARSNVTGARGYHQYATGISWQNSIAKIMDEIYAHTRRSKTLMYIVPRYKN